MGLFVKQESQIFPVVTVTVTPVEPVSATSEVAFDGGLLTTKDHVEASDTDYSLDVLSGPEGGTITYENLTPAICSLDDLPAITRVSDGVAKVKVIRNSAFSRVYYFLFGSYPHDYYYFKNYTADTDGKATLDSMTAAADDAKDSGYYTAFLPASSSFTRNPDSWLADVDLSGNPVATDLFAPTWSTANSGALITPQHWVGVNHWLSGSAANMGAGKKLRFAEEDGTLHTRTILATTRSPGGVGGSYSDLILATLDSPLPAGVPPFPIAGDWFVRSTLGSGYRLTGLGFWVNQTKQCAMVLFETAFPGYHGFCSILIFDGEAYPSPEFCSWSSLVVDFATIDNAAIQAVDSKFRQRAIIGDSGGPVFTRSGDTAVLVGLTSGDGGGPLLSSKAEDLLNAVIAYTDAAAGVNTGYTVTIAPDPTS